MINFILYEEKEKWRENYKKVISPLFLNKKEKYKIYDISKYTKKVKEDIHSLVGKPIYILDMDMNPSGLELAKKIRYKGDWTSPIILMTSFDKEKDHGFTSKVLAIDVIKKEEDLNDSLTKAILIALQIYAHFKTFNFLYNNELYQIPYNDILYFEKDLNHNYTSIVTKNNVYKIKQSIKKIEATIGNTSNFFKTHQSCIVNLRNVKKVDFHEHIIYFKNTETDLLSRNKKKELKVKLEQGIYL